MCLSRILGIRTKGEITTEQVRNVVAKAQGVPRRMRDAIEKQGIVKGRWILVVMAVLLLLSQPVWAQDSHESGLAVPPPTTLEWAIWGLAIGLSIVSLVFAFKFNNDMKGSDEGDEDMIRIARHVQDGAWAYLKQQYNCLLYTSPSPRD